MPAHRRRVNNIAFSRDEGINPLDCKAQLTALNDPHFGKVVEVAAIRRLVFHVGGISANDIGVSAILSNGEDRPRSGARMLLIHIGDVEI